MFQLQELDEDGAVEALAATEYDMLVIEAGYNFSDWAYDDDLVRDAASEADVSPENSMITFIEELGNSGRAIDPNFLVVAQNAIYLIDADPDRYINAIDAIAIEDTWFHGWGDSDWDDPDGGDQRDRHDDDYSTKARLAQVSMYQKAGLPVFSVDYSLNKDNASMVYNEARSQGFIPLVTRVALSRLTETPPTKLASE